MGQKISDKKMLRKKNWSKICEVTSLSNFSLIEVGFTWVGELGVGVQGPCICP